MIVRAETLVCSSIEVLSFLHANGQFYFTQINLSFHQRTNGSSSRHGEGNTHTGHRVEELLHLGIGKLPGKNAMSRAVLW